jgi:DNA-binding CsgD family transcriptional regulator
MWRDEHDDARDGFERAAAASTARGDGYGTTLCESHLAIVEWRAGRWDLALAFAEQALAAWGASGDPGGVSVVLYCRGFILAHLGLADAALADVARARAVDAPGTLMAARYDWIESHVALNRGDVARATVLLARTASAFDELGLAHPGLRLYLSDALDAFVAGGLLAEAEAIAEPLVELGRRHDLPRATAIGLRGRGLVYAARGDVTAALEELEAATAALERFVVPFECGRTWLALGSVQRRARRRRAARESLGRALAVFEDLAAEPWAARARAELGRIGGRAPSGGELTQTEQRVAELVAEGRSNKEVAAELIVSVHTVEAALTSIYRKLDVRSRTELARKLSPG